MDYQQIFDSVKGDRNEFMIKCAQIRFKWSYEKAKEHVEYHSPLDSFRHKWNELAPEVKKNRAKEEEMRQEYSPTFNFDIQPKQQIRQF